MLGFMCDILKQLPAGWKTEVYAGASAHNEYGRDCNQCLNSRKKISLNSSKAYRDIESDAKARPSGAGVGFAAGGKRTWTPLESISASMGRW